MSEAKMKVKDLAAELGTATKDLLHALRELDIPAKSTMSSLSMEDVQRVRRHFAPGDSNVVTRREVQPGVIVRRRRVEASAEAESMPPAAPEESVPPKKAAEKKASQPKRAKAEKVEPAGEKPVPEVSGQAGPDQDAAEPAVSKSAKKSVKARSPRPAAPSA
ncbi:MAG: translation initiation factor IF-2 N-terminal domain-containing protein, partial [Betaproteobacteria bacterium]|nr:translation initiation factor IF-2 N-terminal domain-containing protein [Betaproteobacteria bacterium]